MALSDGHCGRGAGGSATRGAALHDPPRNDPRERATPATPVPAAALRRALSPATLAPVGSPVGPRHSEEVTAIRHQTRPAP